jgi:RNA polymerase sigma factor (sigma-70 family)
MVRACETRKTTKPRPASQKAACRRRASTSGNAGDDAKQGSVKTDTRQAVKYERRSTRLRAERLLMIEIGYLYHRSFDEPGVERKILRPPSAQDEGARGRRAPSNADFYLARLYEVPLLSQEVETHLFRKMNYLKFRADRLRQKLNPRTATVSQLDKIERLQAEAQETRNQIIEANLRLVFSLAKRYASVGSSAFDEFMGEGHVTLMRAVEKFDFSRGVKFSTYATWAVVNGCNALLKKQSSANRQAFCQSIDGVEDYIADHRVTAGEERSVQELRRAVGELLLGLNSRERAIIEARFGFDLNQSPTLKELGEGLGISKERVRQLQQRALEKLRTLAADHKMELPERCAPPD